MVIGIDASRANVRERTGTEWYAFHLIRALTAIDRSNRYVLYLTEQPIDDLRQLGPNVTYRILGWPFRLLWSQLRLSLEMLRRPPDLLFVPAHTIPIIHPRSTVTTLHDVGFERFPELYGRRPIGRPGLTGRLLGLVIRLLTLGRYGNSELDYHRWSARLAASKAAHVITVSQFTKSEIISCYGTDAARISVVHLGFDRTEFQRPPPPAIDSAVARFRIARPYAIFVGRLERKKNITGVINALARARRTLPTLQLVLIGNPGLGWGEAERLIRMHRLDAAVYRLGWQPRHVYVPLLAGATALVFISRYEGFGLPVLEAFAVDTPVIVASGSALPEVAGSAAIAVAPDDTDGAARALIDLASDNQLRRALLTRARQRLALFSWSRVAQATLAILERVGQRR